LTGLDKSVLQIKTTIVSCHTADSKPDKQEVNGTVILPPLVFPGLSLSLYHSSPQPLPLPLSSSPTPIKIILFYLSFKKMILNLIFKKPRGKNSHFDKKNN
jgi:hypothetical protein